MIDNKQPSVLASLDWWTIGIYLVLLIFGWVSVCGASYNYGDNEIFSLGARSGMQIIWIGTSIALGLVILLLDDRFYDTFLSGFLGYTLRGKGCLFNGGKDPRRGQAPLLFV